MSGSQRRSTGVSPARAGATNVPLPTRETTRPRAPRAVVRLRHGDQRAAEVGGEPPHGRETLVGLQLAALDLGDDAVGDLHVQRALVARVELQERRLHTAAASSFSDADEMRRATPSSIAAAVTALATASTTRGSKTLGTTYSGDRSSGLMIPAIA